jgi:hypothetical protein
MVESRLAVRTENAVVADFDTAARQNVLQETVKKFQPGEGEMADLSRLIVAIVKRDMAILDPFQAVVGKRNAEHVAAQILEDFVTGTGMLTMNHPRLLPDIGSDPVKKTGFVQSGSELAAKNQREGANGDEKLRVFRLPPVLPIDGKPTRRNEHVDVGMEKHRTGPGMQDRQYAESCTQKARVSGEFLQRGGGGFHQQAINDLGMRASQGSQRHRQGEGDQIVGTWK